MAPAYCGLRALLQRVVARALDVAEPALEAGGAVEAGAAGELHGQLDGADGVLGHEGAADHHLVDALGRGGVALNRRDHGAVAELCRPERGVHPAGEVEHVRPGGPAARELEREVARALGHAEIDGVDQREGDGGDDLEERVPFAGLALERDRARPARRGPRAPRRASRCRACRACARSPRSAPRAPSSARRSAAPRRSPSSSRTAPVIRRSPAGAPEVNTLRAEIR